jgi:hypothetical protein
VTLEVVAVPDAPLGAADATRRWGVRCPDAKVRWPGVTRPEAAALVAGVTAGAVPPDEVLIQVELGVVLSDGAGPYLVDADGLLVLVVDAHPVLAGLHIAIAQPGPERARLGAVRPLGTAGCWSWVCRADVPATDRIAALDALVGADREGALQAWVARVNAAGIPYGRTQ